MEISLNTIIQSFLQVANVHMSYLSKWYLDKPVVISPYRYKELEQIQKLIYRSIYFYIKTHTKYEHIFPTSDFIKDLSDIYKSIPYKPGTYRPDFLISSDGNIKICEIGARFPLNGYFISGIAELIGLSKFPSLIHSPQRAYEQLLKYLFEYWGNQFSEICVLKGSDPPCDIKYYVPFFESAGIKVNIISPLELIKDTKILRDKAVINEFNQMEIEQLPKSVLEAIAESNALNDMRTIFQIHDKRFLAVLNNDSFLSQFLEEHEMLFLKQYLIPTYTYHQNINIWEEAMLNKENWVLKHCLLGKSEKVYIGYLCDTYQWEKLFMDPEIKHMVLQPFIKQKKVSASIGNQNYNDYVVGTLLCFDNNFFGPGIFRTSSFEITNRIDDRKMAPCITAPNAGNENGFIL